MVRDGACRATRKDGSPCSSRVVLPSGFCAMHDPDRQAAVAAARRKGGANKATTVRAEKLLPSHMRPVLGAVLAALRDVRDGTLPAQRATAIAALASAACRVYTVGLLEQRIEELEA